MMQAGAQWLAGQLKANASQRVIYARGAQSFCVQATLGRKLLKTTDSYGETRIEVTDMDFLILATDLVLNRERIEPKSGDMVRVTQGDQVLTYEVTAYGNEPAWRYSDQFNTVLRIHTKFVATEEA